MIGMRRGVSIVVALLLLVCLGSCGLQTDAPNTGKAAETNSPSLTPIATIASTPNPTPTRTPVNITAHPTATGTNEPDATNEPEETEEPDPIPVYDIPGMAEAGLTDAGYQKIDAMIHGLLYITTEDVKNVKSISRFSLVYFAWVVIDDYLNVTGYDEKEAYTKREVENIINSAFSVKYSVKNGDGKSEDYSTGLVYENGEFSYVAGEGDPYWVSHAYKIVKTASNRISVYFDAFKEGGGLDISSFRGKFKIILQTDKSSIFGYRIISFAKITNLPIVVSVSASSILPESNGISYSPENTTDNNLKTGWAAGKRAGEWIKVSFDKLQTITGLSISIDDRNRSDEDYDDFLMTSATLEFSDGTTMDWNIQSASYPDDDYSIAFDKEVKTEYVKITFVETEEDIIYIAEIKPF